MDMSNAALQSYLDYYVGLDAAPQFAVLITGSGVPERHGLCATTFPNELIASRSFSM